MTVGDRAPEPKPKKSQWQRTALAVGIVGTYAVVAVQLWPNIEAISTGGIAVATLILDIYRRH